MKPNYINYLLSFILATGLTSFVYSQSSPDLFVNDWKAKTIKNPIGINTSQTGQTSSVLITVNATDTVNKVSKYIFGGNLNPYSPLFKKDTASLRHLKNLNPSVLRWPGGNLSNEYFWNAKTAADLPDDLPGTKYWHGSDPLTKDAITPDYYKTLEETNSTGCICVNYSYARYGTSNNSVQRAAHLAADWVRYDKGRTRFWEIGNENYGNWQAGYEIDPAKYTDSRPRFISGAIYGEHCRVFIDSMRAAAAEVGSEIYIGVQAWEDYTSWDPIQTAWNDGLFGKVGNKADFIILHNYYTPYQTNSTIPVIWKSLENTSHFVEVLNAMVRKHSLKPIPLALTEYNMQGQDSGQTISYINGMHAAMVLSDAIKYGFGMAERWSTVGFWGGVGDLGTFSYAGEPGVPEGSMRPEFYYLYYLQKFFGDVMVRSESNHPDIVCYASTFSSGQNSLMLVNKGQTAKMVKITLDNFQKGSKYHRYVLTGGTDNGNFSGRVYVNGQGPSFVKGGPSATYDKLPPLSTDINGDIVIEIPRYGTVFLLIEGKPRPEYQASKIEEDGTKIQVNLTMPVSDLVSPAGFSVMVNNSEIIEITSVSLSAYDFQTLILNLSEEVTAKDKLVVSYYNGTIVSEEGDRLIHFEEKQVDNLIAGSAPIAKAAQTLTDSSVLVSFSKKLNIASSDNMKLFLKGTPAIELPIESATFSDNDSSKLILSGSFQLQSYNLLILDYSDTVIKSTDGGILDTFDIAVSNHISPEIPKLLSSALSNTGYEISLIFDQLMSDAFLQKPYFTVKVNGSEVQLKSTNTVVNILKISFTQAINYGETITISYAGGEWSSFAGVKVDDIIDLSVPNTLLPMTAIPVPGTIQAEKFAVNTGTQTENTSDTGGGLNIGYIDSGDWLEYLISVPDSGSYVMTFRLAANTSAGQINLIVPGQLVEDIGTVIVPVTGGWQKWVSVTTKVNLVAGTQRLRLYFEKGGCNLNWVNIEKEAIISLNELEKYGELVVYPNPAKDQISIQSSGASFNHIKILNLLGEPVLISNFLSSNAATINLQGLANGCYILVIGNDDQKISKMLIVNNVNN